MKLHNMKPAPGSNKKRKRLGCGRGSGHGKTSTRGQKGQCARSGGGKAPGFEGGQMPLYRRIPKRGFNSPHHKEYALINLGMLESLFEDGAKINIDTMVEKGIIKDKTVPVKILARGDIKKKFYIEANAFSSSAREKLEKLGGEIKKI